MGDLTTALHLERNEKNTRNVDCWACEAATSEVILGLISALTQSRATTDHLALVLERAVPDADERMALWRAYWKEQIAAVAALTEAEKP